MNVIIYYAAIRYFKCILQEGTWDDRGRDGGTNFMLRIKEQETRLNLYVHDDDDDDKLYFAG